jgi:cyclase
VEDLVEAVRAGADAVLCASILHYGQHTVEEVKRSMADADVPVRLHTNGGSGDRVPT